MVWVIDNIVTLVREFTAVATSDPLSAVLVTLGGLITAFSVLFFGYLSVGGIVSYLRPETSRGTPEAGH